ncbi:MAG: hypothetical protein ACXWV9_01595 [Flavisolibacter sp.]
MITSAISTNSTDYAQYAIWLITMVVVAFGFRYAKDIISFVLDRLYGFFIENDLLRK